MNLFPLPISLHQGDSGGTLAWKSIPGNCRYFHFLPVVPMKIKKIGRKKQWRQKECNVVCFRIPLHISHKFSDKNPTFKGGRRCGAKEPSTCTPLSAPGSSQVMPKEGSLILGGILPPRSNLLPSWTLPSSMDVAITPPHLPPPGASLTFRICFPLLRSSERRCRVGVPRGRAGVAGSTWGRLRSGRRARHWSPASPASPPSQRHLCLACSWDSLANKCSEWHSGGSLIPAQWQVLPSIPAFQRANCKCR